MKLMKPKFSNYTIKLAKNNDEVALINLLHRLESSFKLTAKEVMNDILDNNIEEVTECIRQEPDCKLLMLFYEILNSDFGYKVIKFFKELK